ncbi:MAG TPA: metallophosphoesterase [Chloroflexi bacterium]|nr:metallophosphoesterase [Chloroflexota bacterium]
MRIGVISDPHGCLVGLKAALAWLEKEGLDLVVCAGDVVNFGPQPNECISLLAERNIASVQGNCDRDILLPAPAGQQTDERTAQITAIDDWCRERLTSASRRWLASLPPRLTPVPGVLIVHGGVADPEEIVDADARPSFPPGVSVVAAGHLHAPFVTCTGQGVWVNAGSVGRPCDGDPQAALAVLEQRSEGWRASIHRIPFDLELAAQMIRKAIMPYVERLVETQRKACWW